MSIEVYIPTNLQSEMVKFSNAKGNYNVDYRAPNNNSKYYFLDTPYSLLDSSNSTTTFKSFPLKPGTNHVSGNNKNYRSMTRDYVFKNTGSSSTCLNILSTTLDCYPVVYSNSVVSGVNIIHTFLLGKLPPDTVTKLIPLMVSETDTPTVGIINKKRVSQTTIVEQNYKYGNVTIDRVNNKLYLQDINGTTRRTRRKYQQGDVLDLMDVKDEIEYLTCFVGTNTVAGIDTYNQQSKLKFITTITPNTNPVLNNVYPNYTTYLDSNYPTNNYSQGLSLSLGAGESVLITEEIVLNDATYSSEIVIATDTLMYGEFLSGSLSSYCQCLNIQLPTSVQNVQKEVVSDGNDNDPNATITVTQVPAIFTMFFDDVKIEAGSVTDINTLYKTLRPLLLQYGVYLHMLKSNTFVFIRNSNATVGNKCTIFYKGASYNSINDKTLLLNSNNTTINSDSSVLPTNLSFSLDTNTPSTNKIYEDYFYYDCYSFGLNTDSNFTSSLSTSITFSVDPDTLKNNSTGVMLINNTSINLSKDLTKSTTPIQDYCSYLNSIQSSCKFTTNNANQVICNNIDGNINSYTLKLTSFKLDSSYNYPVTSIDDSLIYDLVGN